MNKVSIAQLIDLRKDNNTSEERFQLDRDMYLKGRRMYPTAPEDALPTGFSGRDRGCYMMGYSLSKFEDENELLQEESHT